MITLSVPSGLKSLKSKVDKLDIGKIETTPIDLSKLSNAVKNDVLKQDVYNAKIKDIEDRISDIIKLATNTTVNAKINKVKNKIPSITNNLATSTAGTSVENKIINVTDLVKDADYDAEIKEIKSKYFTTCDFHKFMNDILKTKITAKKLVNESGSNGKIKTLATEKTN